MLAAGIWHVHTHIVGAMLSTYLPIVGTVYLILYSMTAIPEGSKIDTLSGPGLYVKLQCFIWACYIIPRKLIFSLKTCKDMKAPFCFLILVMVQA